MWVKFFLPQRSRRTQRGKSFISLSSVSSVTSVVNFPITMFCNTTQGYRAFTDGVRIDVGYRIDLLVQHTVIVELKSVSAIAPIHKAQLLSYLKLSGKHIGLLINFNVLQLKDGIIRLAN